MRMKTASGACLLSLALSACQDGNVFSPGSAAPPSLVPVSSVVNAIKCELAETFKDGRFTRDFVRTDREKDEDVRAALHLENVVAGTTSVEGGFEVVPLGITFGPKGSHSRSVSTGQSVDVEFSYDLPVGTELPAFCAMLDENVKVKGDPFVVLLESVQKQYASFGKGAPKVQLRDFTYTTEFEIERAEEFGAEVKFLVFSLGAKREQSKTGKQSLELKFDLSGMPPLIPG